MFTLCTNELCYICFFFIDDLKRVTSLKPTIVLLERQYGYYDWTAVLTADGNKKETEMLCKFAKQNNIIGYKLTNVSPESVSKFCAFCD